MVKLISEHNESVRQFDTGHAAFEAVARDAEAHGVPHRVELHPWGVQRIGFDWAGTTLWWRLENAAAS